MTKGQTKEPPFPINPGDWVVTGSYIGAEQHPQQVERLTPEFVYFVNSRYRRRKADVIAALPSEGAARRLIAALRGEYAARQDAIEQAMKRYHKNFDHYAQLALIEAGRIHPPHGEGND